jgi:hypothetical protein
MNFNTTPKTNIKYLNNCVEKISCLKHKRSKHFIKSIKSKKRQNLNYILLKTNLSDMKKDETTPSTVLIITGIITSLKLNVR